MLLYRYDMKLVNQDPFSNGTEYMIWEEENCAKCVKASRLKKEGDSEEWDEYTKLRCAIQRDIFTRMVSNEPIAQRTIDICSKRYCPYRQEKHKRYEKNKGLPKLFEI